MENDVIGLGYYLLATEYVFHVIKPLYQASKYITLLVYYGAGDCPNYEFCFELLAEMTLYLVT